jgi:hypothetical protein
LFAVELLEIGVVVFVVTSLLTHVMMTMLLTNDMRDMWRRPGVKLPGWWRSWFRYATSRRITDGTYIPGPKKQKKQ